VRNPGDRPLKEFLLSTNLDDLGLDAQVLETVWVRRSS
jgi:hypothetical protein